MKSYTDVGQSKKLAEFLAIESADSHYVRQTHNFRGDIVDGKWSHPKYGNPNSRYANYMIQNFSSYETIPCWSLVALFVVLPKGTNISTPKPVNELGYCCWNQYDEIYASNPVDACYEMVLKLHELNLL